MKVALYCLLAASALLGPAAALGSVPVKVVSTTVTLRQAAVAPVVVRCRAHRVCRGVVTLGVPQRGLPVGCPTCNVTVGAARFRIPGGATRTVAVPRRGADDLSYYADAWDVIALATLRGERPGPAAAARRQRNVRVDAPPALPRPATALTLVDVLSRWGLDQPRDDNALRFEVRAPRGTDSVRVEIRGHTVDLHPAMGSGAYFVPSGSFAPAGVILHAETPIGRDEFHYGERYPMRITACQGDTCQALEVEREISQGAYGYGGPICTLRLGAGFTRKLEPAVVHPSPLGVLVAAPAG